MAKKDGYTIIGRALAREARLLGRVGSVEDAAAARAFERALKDKRRVRAFLGIEAREPESADAAVTAGA